MIYFVTRTYARWPVWLVAHVTKLKAQMTYQLNSKSFVKKMLSGPCTVTINYLDYLLLSHWPASWMESVKTLQKTTIIKIFTKIYHLTRSIHRSAQSHKNLFKIQKQTDNWSRKLPSYLTYIYLLQNYWKGSAWKATPSGTSRPSNKPTSWIS